MFIPISNVKGTTPIMRQLMLRMTIQQYVVHVKVIKEIQNPSFQCKPEHIKGVIGVFTEVGGPRNWRSEKKSLIFVSFGI